jgi:hypothetical protein
MRHIHLNKLTSFALAGGLAVIMSLGASSVTNARAVGDPADTQGSAVPIESLEQVDSISVLTRPWSWRAIDDRTLILWTTASRPYLVKLRIPSYDLKWVNVIGVTSLGDRIYSKFDSVTIRGFSYPIDHIYKLTREQARNWERDS